MYASTYMRPDIFRARMMAKNQERIRSKLGSNGWEVGAGTRRDPPGAAPKKNTHPRYPLYSPARVAIRGVIPGQTGRRRGGGGRKLRGYAHQTRLERLKAMYASTYMSPDIFRARMLAMNQERTAPNSARTGGKSAQVQGAIPPERHLRKTPSPGTHCTAQALGSQGRFLPGNKKAVGKVAAES